jgi:sugar phosphate isomerase/epimerase
MGANYVARFVHYQMTEGWSQGNNATEAYYRPIETFGERFAELLQDIRALGFTTLDVWTAQLNWAWASEEHARIARQLLAEHQMHVASLAGHFGSTRAELESACRLARELGTTVLGGSSSLPATDRPSTVAILKEHGIRLGLENHPQKNASEMLALIGDGGDGRLGTAIDTGWYATHGYDAVRAVRELAPYVFHIHLKDILAPGAHNTCRYGQGCVDIPGCVAALEASGYHGFYSIEHEPELFDPGSDCQAMLPMLRNWLAQA